MHCTRCLNVRLRRTFRHSFREKCFLRRTCRRRKPIIFIFSLRRKNSARLCLQSCASFSRGGAFVMEIFPLFECNGLHNTIEGEENCKNDNIERRFVYFSLGIDSNWRYNKLDTQFTGISLSLQQVAYDRNEKENSPHEREIAEVYPAGRYLSF